MTELKGSELVEKLRAGHKFMCSKIIGDSLLRGMRSETTFYKPNEISIWGRDDLMCSPSDMYCSSKNTVFFGELSKTKLTLYDLQSGDVLVFSNGSVKIIDTVGPSKMLSWMFLKSSGTFSKTSVILNDKYLNNMVEFWDSKIVQILRDCKDISNQFDLS